MYSAWLAGVSTARTSSSAKCGTSSPVSRSIKTVGLAAVMLAS
jgi:hypothetical protein